MNKVDANIDVFRTTLMNQAAYHVDNTYVVAEAIGHGAP